METIKNIELINSEIDFRNLKLLNREDLNQVLALCKSYDRLHAKIVEDRLNDNQLDVQNLFATMLFTCVKLSSKK